MKYVLQFEGGLFLSKNGDVTRNLDEAWISDKEHVNWYCNYRRSRGLDLVVVELKGEWGAAS